VTLKRVRKARFSRIVARALCVLLLAPQMLTWSMHHALAQRADRTVIVIDFSNRSSVGSPLLGRRAASAMTLQLRQSDNWDPVSQNQVDQKIADLRLRPPYDRVQLQTLARALDAGSVLTGVVLSARVTKNPAQATVRMVVRLMDVASGELINGAVATGTAQHIGLDSAEEDVLLDEALSRAAFDARQRMERYTIPEGTVLNTTVVGGTRTDALLNIGTRQGVRLGMQFVVLRGRELVGYVSASNVDADKTVAAVTQNFRGVKPEDTVRAIYTLPEGADAADVGTVQPGQTKPGDVVVPDEKGAPRSRHRSLTGPIRIFAGLLLAAGIYALATRKTNGATSPFSTTARATKLEVGDPTQSAAVRITWNRPRQIPANDVIQYQVYRIDPTGISPLLVGLATEADRSVFDTMATTTIPQYYTGTGNGAATINTTALTVPPIIPGHQYRYEIQTIYNEGTSLGTTGSTTGGTTTGTTTGTTGTVAVLISSPSKTSGVVTPVLPPTPTSPADQSTVDLTSVTFTFTTVLGADLYSVQVSANPTDPNSYQQVAQFQNPSKTAGRSVSLTANIAGRFAGRTLLAWRVGARNSSDAAPPIGGYVFSDPLSFSPQ
jgi:hypothetical protein